MKARVITGILITVVFVSVLALAAYVHPAFFDIFVLLLAALGTYEVIKAVSNYTSAPIIGLNIASLVVGFGAFWFSQYFFKSYASGLTGYFISLAVMVLVTVVFTACSKRYVKGNAFSTIFVMLYPGALLIFLLGINYFINLDLGGVAGSTPYRNDGLALLFVVPTLTDVFAFLVGSRLKGKKLCPTISPNKTVSGAIGGLLGGVLGAGALLLILYLCETFSLNVMGLALINDSWLTTIVNFLVIGLIGSVADQIGDLFASLIKRRAGIKDFSNLLPGHGGILDRIDGFMFSGVIIYLYCATLVLIL